MMYIASIDNEQVKDSIARQVHIYKNIKNFGLYFCNCKYNNYSDFC